MFNRLWYGSLKRPTAMTPGAGGPNPMAVPPPCVTPTFQPGYRTRRWQSDSDNVNHRESSEYDARSVNGGDMGMELLQRIPFPVLHDFSILFNGKKIVFNLIILIFGFLKCCIRVKTFLVDLLSKS